MQQSRDANSSEPSAADNKDESALGHPIGIFRAKLTTCLLIAVSGLVMLGGGVWLVIKEGAPESGAWVFTFSLVVLALAYVLGKSSYLVCPGGIIQVRFGRRRVCRWDEVSEIVDRRIKQRLVSSRLCVLVRKYGEPIELSDLVGDFGAMMALVRQQAESRGIPSKEECVDK